jgi:hypothetical protein
MVRFILARTVFPFDHRFRDYGDAADSVLRTERRLKLLGAR